MIWFVLALSCHASPDPAGAPPPDLEADFQRRVSAARTTADHDALRDWLRRAGLPVDVSSRLWRLVDEHRYSGIAEARAFHDRQSACARASTAAGPLAGEPTEREMCYTAQAQLNVEGWSLERARARCPPTFDEDDAEHRNLASLCYVLWVGVSPPVPAYGYVTYVDNFRKVSCQAAGPDRFRCEEWLHATSSDPKMGPVLRGLPPTRTIGVFVRSARGHWSFVADVPQTSP